MNACFACVMLAAISVGCATLREDDPLGTQRNPVRTDGRSGEISYLGRLRCPSGGAPHFHIERHGPRGPYGNQLDRFTLRCVLDNRSFEVWIDHHHAAYVEDRGVAGLRVAEVGGLYPALERLFLPNPKPAQR